MLHTSVPTRHGALLPPRLDTCVPRAAVGGAPVALPRDAERRARRGPALAPAGAPQAPRGYDARQSLALAQGPELCCLTRGGRAAATWKLDNQDSYLAQHIPPAPGARFAAEGALVLGVFDGHGARGGEASRLVRDSVARSLAEAATGRGLAPCEGAEGGLVACASSKAPHASPIEAALVRAFADADRDLDLTGHDFSRSGTTATHRDAFRRPVGPMRVCFPGTNAPGLAVSRALGDRQAASIGVSSTPEIASVALPGCAPAVLAGGARSAEGREARALGATCATPGAHHVLIVASDGLWQWIGNEAAVDIASACASAQEAADCLAEVARLRWVMHQGGACVDDITVSVLFLPCGAGAESGAPDVASASFSRNLAP
ncbi:hypothetical protein QBZ16_005306 [Prototheca wickerhamii]|uniref:protein-serine/threonine phosphatase n=1 Tax=Prototheca wickerhamii TaxID=3111 RepID=A0AAD9MM86_PROWI|nr:hypothetical protein QBZ16_005306 [Prototheca wickerhamii]